MTPALKLVGADLVRVLGRIRERPAVDRAVADRAQAVAREVQAAEEGSTARVVRRGPSDYAVTVTRPDDG